MKTIIYTYFVGTPNTAGACFRVHDAGEGKVRLGGGIVSSPGLLRPI